MARTTRHTRTLPRLELAEPSADRIALVRTSDEVPSEFETLAGCMLDGTTLEDTIDVHETIKRYALYGSADADSITEAWLQGHDVAPELGRREEFGSLVLATAI